VDKWFKKAKMTNVKDKRLEKILEKHISTITYGISKQGELIDNPRTRRVIRNALKEARDYGFIQGKVFEKESYARWKLNELYAKEMGMRTDSPVPRPTEQKDEKPSRWQRLTAFFRKEGKLSRNFKEAKKSKADWDNPQVGASYELKK